MGDDEGCRLDDVVVALVDQLQKEMSIRGVPLFVGLDGRSGTGKSTVAEAIAARFEASGEDVAVIEGDQFYAGGNADSWDRRSPAAKADQVIDWRRQRQVLQQLRDGGTAEWQAFDWNAPDWDSELVPLLHEPICARTGSIVLLEGAYSCRPELHHLLDVRVLVDLPRDVRRRRLLEREGDDYRADWEARWSAAEDHYFDTVMTPDRFDLVVDLGNCSMRTHLETP